jgi:phenol hydroxylase P4 protein
LNSEYSFPSRGRRELYGDDILVHLMWRGNPLFASPATFRLSPSLTWAEFVSHTVEPWATMDPRFDASRVGGWILDGKAITPPTTATLEQLSVGHKSLLTFEG